MLMLQGERLTEFRECYWRKQACVFRNAIDFSAYPIAINDVCQLTLDELVESRMVNASHELFLGPFEKVGDSDGLCQKIISYWFNAWNNIWTLQNRCFEISFTLSPPGR